MTWEETKKMYLGQAPTVARPVCIPCPPPTACPTPEDKMAHAEMAKPPKPEDYNRVSVTEMNHLHQFKGMDDLHRSDAIAKEFNRGTKLTEYLKEKGVEKFKSHYFKN